MIYIYIEYIYIVVYKYSKIISHIINANVDDVSYYLR